MADPAFRNNPWSAAHWNLTRQGEYVRKYGEQIARTKAKEGGTYFGGPKPVPQNVKVIERHWIIQKNSGLGGGVSVGGGGLIGAGSSGEGAP